MRRASSTAPPKMFSKVVVKGPRLDSLISDPTLVYLSGRSALSFSKRWNSAEMPLVFFYDLLSVRGYQAREGMST